MVLVKAATKIVRSNLSVRSVVVVTELVAVHFSFESVCVIRISRVRLGLAAPNAELVPAAAMS